MRGFVVVCVCSTPSSEQSYKSRARRDSRDCCNLNCSTRDCGQRNCGTRGCGTTAPPKRDCNAKVRSSTHSTNRDCGLLTVLDFLGPPAPSGHGEHAPFHCTRTWRMRLGSDREGSSARNLRKSPPKDVSTVGALPHPNHPSTNRSRSFERRTSPFDGARACPEPRACSFCPSHHQHLRCFHPKLPL